MVEGTCRVAHPPDIPALANLSFVALRHTALVRTTGLCTRPTCFMVINLKCNTSSECLPMIVLLDSAGVCITFLCMNIQYVWRVHIDDFDVGYSTALHHVSVKHTTVYSSYVQRHKSMAYCRTALPSTFFNPIKFRRNCFRLREKEILYNRILHTSASSPPLKSSHTNLTP